MKKRLWLLSIVLVTTTSFAQMDKQCSYFECASWDKTNTDQSNTQATQATDDQAAQDTDNANASVSHNILKVSKAPNEKTNQAMYGSNDDSRVLFIVAKNGAKPIKIGKKTFSALAALKKTLKNRLDADQYAKIDWSTDSHVQLVVTGETGNHTLDGDYTVTTVNFDALNTDGYQVVMDVTEG